MFAYFTSFLTYLLPDLTTSWKVGPFRLQTGGHKRQPNLALVFLCCCIFCFGCMFAFAVLDFQYLTQRLSGKNVFEITNFVSGGT